MFDNNFTFFSFYSEQYSNIHSLNYCRCMLPTVQHRHVAIARLTHPTNLGRTMQDLRFIIIVIAPSRAVCVYCISIFPTMKHNFVGFLRKVQKQHWKRPALSPHFSLIWISGNDWWWLKVSNSFDIPCFKRPKN